jgi:hypothetical protein
MNPGDRTTIERFVRDTLGCHCPDEVFQHVQVGPLPQSTGGAAGHRLVVGDRLLIHIVAAPDGTGEPGWIERAALAGRDERDRLAYSRYRLVVASTVETVARTSLEQRFTRALGDDDHAHLHVLAPELLPIV